jgi:hypothetical protein
MAGSETYEPGNRGATQIRPDERDRSQPFSFLAEDANHRRNQHRKDGSEPETSADKRNYRAAGRADPQE